jgi:AraC-like DNA-binding protein
VTSELVFLHSAYIPRCTAVVDKRFAGYYAVQLMTRGNVRLKYDQQGYELRGRWMWSCWPGPRIYFSRADGASDWAHRYVAFTGPLVGRWLEMNLLPFHPQPLPSTRIIHQFDELLGLVRRLDAWGRLRAVNLLEAILLGLAEKRPEKNDPWLAEVRERIARQGTLWPDYEVTARQLGIGLSTLRRRYRNAAGVPLHTEMMSRRAAAAQDLLADTSLPIKEIAERLGYRDVYFFSRQFRGISGVSPAAFRRSRQEK